MRPENYMIIFSNFVNLGFSKTAYGSFGADMQVSLINDGPFTLILEA